MEAVLLRTLLSSIKITALVFAMMLLTDVVNVKTAGAVGRLLRGGRWRQYVVAAFLGATPGCLGAFLAAYLYAHGFLSFGAIVAAMVATSGDESFVMFQVFPLKALGLHALLFVVGVLSGWLSDEVAAAVGLRRSEACPLAERCDECPPSLSWLALPGLVAPNPEDGEKRWHFAREHVWGHIVKGHLWRVFLWTFVALLLVKVLVRQGPLSEFVRGHLNWTLLPLAALVGLVPESGPHMVFVFLHKEGLAPFSVLLASSVVQDGHGMLPLLALCPRDALLVKVFNFAIGLSLGGLLLLLGL